MEHCTAGRWALWICFAYPSLMPTTRKAALTNSPKQRSWSDMLRSCWDHVGIMLGSCWGTPTLPCWPPPHMSMYIYISPSSFQEFDGQDGQSLRCPRTPHVASYSIYGCPISTIVLSVRKFPFTATSIETRRAIPLRHTLILSSPWMIRVLFPTEQNIKRILLFMSKTKRT